MDNEATKVLNEQQNENNVKDVKKGSNIFGQGMATAAGAAVGTGAAMAADHVYEHVTDSAETATPEEQPVEGVQAEETPNAAVEEVAAVEEEVAPVEEEVTAQEAPAPQAEPAEAIAENVVPADGEYIDNAEVVAAADTPEDNEVHVIGAAAVDNEEGGQAILMELENSSGDRAMVVDIESDGTIDYLVHDDNMNGEIEENEIYDIHEEGWQTEVYLADYAEQLGQQNAPDDVIMASDEDNMPDYMNDADAGLMDA